MLVVAVDVVAAVVVVGLFDLGWVLRFVNVVGCCGFFLNFFLSEVTAIISLILPPPFLRSAPNYYYLAVGRL